MLKRYVLAFCAFVIFALPFGAKAVTVGPVRLEYSVDPGSSVSGTMLVMNEGGNTETFYPSFERFTEDNGQKVFTRETSDLSTWFNIPSSATLKGGEQRIIPFTINVPQNAAPGGHFAVIWWSTTPPGDSDKQVAIVTRAGVLVYLTVSGNIQESGEISQFVLNAAHNTSFSLPVSFTTLFKNTGNVSVKPAGTITIRNMFGIRTAELPMNEGLGAVLPQSRKSFNTEWNDKGFHFGIYHATLAVSYGASQKMTEAGSWIVLLPWQGVLILFLVLILIFALPKGIRRYNNWIINRSGGSR